MFVSIVSNLDLSFEIEQAQINKTYKNLIEFFKDNSRYFDEKKEYNLDVLVDGVKIPQNMWGIADISRANTIKIIIIPEGTMLAIIQIIVMVVAVAYSIYMYNKMKKQGNTSSLAQGNSIYDVNAQGNAVKYQSIIPENFGYFKCFPSYLTDPHYYYKENKKYIDMVLSQGVGSFEYTDTGEDVLIGNTPLNNFVGCRYSVIDPGEKISEVSFDSALNQMWFNSIDVTSSGKTIKNSVTGVMGSPCCELQSIYFQGENQPKNWSEGDVLQFTDAQQAKDIPFRYCAYPSNFYFGNHNSNYPQPSVHYLDPTFIYVGSSGNGNPVDDDAYSITSKTPIYENGSIVGYTINEMLINLNDGTTTGYAEQWYPLNMGYGGLKMQYQAKNAKKKIWNERYNGKVNSYRLKAGALPDLVYMYFTNYEGTIKTKEKRIPFNLASADAQVLNGHGTYSAIRIKTSFDVTMDEWNNCVEDAWGHLCYLQMGYSGAVKGYADIGEHYSNSYGDNGYYKIKKIYKEDGLIYDVYGKNNEKNATKYLLAKVNPNNFEEEETEWNCFFYAGCVMPTTVVKNITQLSGTKETPIGTFRGNPVGKLGSLYELDFNAPNGIYQVDEQNGAYKKLTVEWQVKYRQVGTTAWNTRNLSFTGYNADELGMTERFELPLGDWEFTVVRISPEFKDSSHAETVKWCGLKCLLGEKDTYTNQTVLTVRCVGSEALSELDDNQFSTLFTRKLPNIYTGELEATTDLAPAIKYICAQSKFGNLFNQLSLAEFDDYAKSKGFEFNGAFDRENTMLDAMRAVANVGLNDLIVKNNELHLTRMEAKTENDYTYIFTPQNMISQPQVTITLNKPDDTKQCTINYTDTSTYKTSQVVASYDKNGDIIYTDYDVSPYSEEIDSLGITSVAQAQAVAGRRLGYLTYTKTQYTIETELDGLNCQYNDYVGLVLNIDLQNVCGRVVAQTDNILTLDCEIPKNSLYIWYRLKDGTPRLLNILAIDGVNVTVDKIPQSWDIDFGSSIEYPYFAVGNILPCWITDIQISENKCTLTLINYDSRVFNSDYVNLGYGLSEYGRSNYGTY